MMHLASRLSALVTACLHLLQVPNVYATSTASQGWESVPDLLAHIVPPTFPDRTFDIRDHGAVADGRTDASAAIARAIAACHAAGGGRVVVPSGDWPTGPIHLKSNVNLHVATGATLRFSTDPSHYPNVHTTWEGVECMNYSPLIYSFDQENIAVTGGGVLDGSASYHNWWGWKNYEKGPPFKQVPDREALFAQGESGIPVADRIFGQGRMLRPSFVQPYRCRNILIEGVTIRRSPFWVIHPVQSLNITVRGVTVDSLGPNNDGCDPEACRNVLIEDCTFNTGDDCIAIKSGRNNDGRRVGLAAENIIIRRCHFRDGHGGFVIGSEISGGCRNVFMEDCTMESERLGSAVRLKNNARRGATIENIYVRRITVARVAGAILNIQFAYEEGARGPHIPVLRNLQLEHVTSRNATRVINVQGIPGAVIEGVRLAHADLAGIKADDSVWPGADVVLEDVSVNRLESATAVAR
jgi:unsaturated rhamnogalacturonyl hydrolase